MPAAAANKQQLELQRCLAERLLLELLHWRDRVDLLLPSQTGTGIGTCTGEGKGPATRDSFRWKGQLRHYCSRFDKSVASKTSSKLAPAPVKAVTGNALLSKLKMMFSAKKGLEKGGERVVAGGTL